MNGRITAETMRAYIGGSLPEDRRKQIEAAIASDDGALDLYMTEVETSGMSYIKSDHVYNTVMERVREISADRDLRARRRRYNAAFCLSASAILLIVTFTGHISVFNENAQGLFAMVGEKFDKIFELFNQIKI